MAEMERTFISERIKSALKTRKMEGKNLGRPNGIKQKSMYDEDRDRIMELYNMGMSIQSIHDKYIKKWCYLSLYEYIKRYKKDYEGAMDESSTRI